MADVAHHNAVLAAGYRRALEVEDKLASIVERVLNAAGAEAARNFSARATDHLTAAAPGPAGTMVAVYPRPEEAAAVAQPGGEPAEILHVTLAFVGDTEPEDVPRILEAVGRVAASHAPLVGSVGGVGAFAAAGPDAPSPSLLLPDVAGLAELRQAVVEALADAGIDFSRLHGWTPHMTVAYTDEPTPGDVASLGAELHFDHLVVARGDVPTAIPFVGVPPLTASTPPQPPPDWTPPAADDVLSVETVVASLKTKTDPVRLAVAERLMKDQIEGIGLSFDVNNPLVSGALAKTAKHITSIAETTRADVMDVIKESYDKGLSIPDTAKAIRAFMREASPWRARMIARTEMSGTVNGSSLAATQVVASATGDSYRKKWLTAPGAEHPRHEDYDDLDGQTVGLDDAFDVGGNALQYPGDPDGAPEDVINCRCTVVYEEAGGGEAEGGGEE